jgi:cleavage and polyadenylation specificity factor subunit 1
MQCYTELTPPTAVTHAVYLPFLSPSSSNLVVAKYSLLQIFTVKTAYSEYSSSYHTSRASISAIHHGEQTRLVLVAEYHLSGTITGLARIKALDTKTGGEALLVQLRDAKMSLAQWDPETHAIDTISIHYYEGEDVSRSPWEPDIEDCHNYLIADPRSQCAILKFGLRSLAVLPIRQAGDEMADDDLDSTFDEPMEEPNTKQDTKMAGEDGLNDDNAREVPYKKSFVLSLTSIDPNMTHLAHLDFLHEYREPTLGILASNQASSDNLIQERKDMMNYYVFTLDLEQKASTMLSRIEHLPYDLNRVIPLPVPIGGALLLGKNEIVHIDQAGRSHAVGVNEFYKACSSFTMTDRSELGLRLEGCEVLQMEGNNVLLILITGELVVLSFKLDGRTVIGMNLLKVANDRGGLVINTQATCAVPLGRGRAFIGSEHGDSAVLAWSRKTSVQTKKKLKAGLIDNPDLSFSEGDLEDEEDDLYQSDDGEQRSLAPSSIQSVDPADLVFKIHDRLLNFAPMREVTLGATATPSSSRDSKGPKTLELAFAIGEGKAGSIAILKREIDPIILTKQRLHDAQSIWSVYAKPVAENKPTRRGPRAVRKNIDNVEHHKYLIVSKSSSEREPTAVYSIKGTELSLYTEGDMETEGRTIDIGTICDNTKIVQILKAEIRTYDSGELNNFPNFQNPVSTVRVGCHANLTHHILPTMLYSSKSRCMCSINRYGNVSGKLAFNERELIAVLLSINIIALVFKRNEIVLFLSMCMPYPI